MLFDVDKIKEQLTIENYFDLLQEWGGMPEYSPFGIISCTICHNPAGAGSRKLYYYTNSNLFHCFTGCDEPNFDIFELCRKVAAIQWNREFSLYQAIRWIANRFNLAGEEETQKPENELKDWKILTKYDKIDNIEIIKNEEKILKVYDDSVLDKFNYSIKITPWIQEGITEEVMHRARIGFYPGGDQITIPHYNKDGRLIGIRGRTLSKEEAELYGKYRPLKIEKQLYNHPLGLNLYGYNWSKDNIRQIRKAIVFESEKSVLMYASSFGWDNNITVACCGSSLSAYQMQMLLDAGAEEIIIGFDRQFQEIGDDEFKHLKRNLLKLREKYKQSVLISFIFDKNMITGYKSSPIDEGPEKFLKLFKERIIL